MRSVLLCAILACATAADLFNHPIATLPTTGQEVKGKFEEHTSVFHAIPYAQAPLGDLRFTPPQPLAPSSDKIDATTIKSMCPQFEFTHGIHLGDEDCLHMSIYVPKNKDSGFNNNKAVSERGRCIRHSRAQTNTFLTPSFFMTPPPLTPLFVNSSLPPSLSPLCSGSSEEPSS
jgi:hypothetical protein